MSIYNPPQSSSGGGGQLAKQTVVGTCDGVNVTFIIGAVINSGVSFIIQNGQSQVEGIDYNVSGTTITYTIAPSADLDGLEHVIYYGASSTNATTWVFDSTPSGTVNGVNTVFTLGISSVQAIVYADGLRVKGFGVDYTHSGATITFTAGRQPFSSISADYLI